MRDLIFVADAHIEKDANDVRVFRSFLREIGPRTHTLIILGDLFNLWIARKRFEQEFQRDIIDQLRLLRMSGVRLVYIEGNRDFHIRRCYQDDPFDAVSGDEYVEEFDGRKFYLQHGDRVNIKDRRYRFWRSCAKSRIVWKIFNAIPLNTAAAIARKLEQLLRSSNLKHKSYFPLERCRSFAEEVFRRSFDIAVIGHLHRAETFEFTMDGARKFFYSLPAWKDEKRYLLFEPGKGGRFIDFIS